jgi:PAS domain S-box-containing protein
MRSELLERLLLLDHAAIEAAKREIMCCVAAPEADGTIVSWNAGAERLYGYSAAEVIGNPISLLVPAAHPDGVPTIRS